MRWQLFCRISEAQDCLSEAAMQHNRGINRRIYLDRHKRAEADIIHSHDHIAAALFSRTRRKLKINNSKHVTKGLDSRSESRIFQSTGHTRRRRRRKLGLTDIRERDDELETWNTTVETDHVEPVLTLPRKLNMLLNRRKSTSIFCLITRQTQQDLEQIADREAADEIIDDSWYKLLLGLM